jgi:hypothetical protein
MSQPISNLADEIVRIVQINRVRINGLEYGQVVFKAHKGRLVEVTASETMQLSAGSTLRVTSLDPDGSKPQSRDS